MPVDQRQQAFTEPIGEHQVAASLIWNTQGSVYSHKRY